MFGSSIVLDNGVVAVGATGFSDSDFTGAVYLFGTSDAPCEADMNHDGALDFFDVSMFLQDQPDWNGDTSFDFFDVSGFLQDISAGCP